MGAKLNDTHLFRNARSVVRTGIAGDSGLSPPGGGRIQCSYVHAFEGAWTSPPVDSFGLQDARCTSK